MGDIISSVTVDSLYIALPLEAHDKIRQLVAFATGRASERSIFVSSKLSRQPVNQAPDEHVSIVPGLKPAQCFRTLFKTYRNAFRTCRGERRTRSW